MVKTWSFGPYYPQRSAGGYFAGDVETGAGDYVVEAWERMTDGGVNGRNSGLYVPYVEYVYPLHTHRELMGYAARR